MNATLILQIALIVGTVVLAACAFSTAYLDLRARRRARHRAKRRPGPRTLRGDVRYLRNRMTVAGR